MNLKNDVTSFNTSTCPVDPATCATILPWDYMGDNTVFQVIHAAGLRTAWSDKHAVYLSCNGPGSNGQSIDDYFGPETRNQWLWLGGAAVLGATEVVSAPIAGALAALPILDSLQSEEGARASSRKGVSTRRGQAPRRQRATPRRRTGAAAE